MIQLVKEKNGMLTAVLYPNDVRSAWLFLSLAVITGFGAALLMILNPMGNPVIFFFPALMLFIGILNISRTKKTRIKVTRNTGIIESDGERRIKAIYVWPHIRRTRGYSIYSPAYYNSLFFGIAAVLEHEGSDWQRVLEKYQNDPDSLYSREGEAAAVLEKMVKDAKTLTIFSRLFPVYKAVKDLGARLQVPVIIALSGRPEIWYPSEIGQPLKTRISKYSKKELSVPELGSVKTETRDGVLSFTWIQKKLLGLIIPLAAAVILFVVAAGSAAEGAYAVSGILAALGFGFAGSGILFFRGHGKNVLEVDQFEVRYSRFRPWKKTRWITIDEIEAILPNRTADRAVFFLGDREKMKISMNRNNVQGVKEGIYRHLYSG
ncbi:MAG: hypothetical protein ACLFSE_15040 [Spirochaetia bacterium]